MIMILAFSAFSLSMLTTNAHATTASSARSTVTASLGFDGLNGTNPCCPLVPPDVQVATGPTNVMEMVNVGRVVYTRQGSLQLVQNLSAFFHTGNDFISDPKVFYDWQSQRWFATITHCVGPSCPTSNGATRVEIGVSTSSDPTQGWVFYNVTAGVGLIADQPTIGVSDDKFVVSFNLFSNSYLGAEWWVLNKNDMISGVPVHTQEFGPDPTLESVHPVQSSSSTSTEYMVSTGASEAGASSSSTVKLFAVTGVPGLSTTNTTVTTLTLHSPVTLSGGGREPVLRCPLCPVDLFIIDTGDFRVQDTAYFNGQIWLGVNSGCNGRVCIRLIQINTNTSTISQEFDYSGGSADVYYPGLRIDDGGNLDIIYGFSSTSIYPSLAVTGQAANDPANTLAPAVTVARGTADNEDGRYGDYFGAAVDPNDPTQIWVAGEYGNQATGSCGTDQGGNTIYCWDTFITQVQEHPASYTLSVSPSELDWICSSHGCNPGLQSATVEISTASASSINQTFNLVYGCGAGSPNCQPTFGVQPGTITILAGQTSGTANLSVQPGLGQRCTQVGGRTDCYTYILISATQNGLVVGQTMLTLYACQGICNV